VLIYILLCVVVLIAIGIIMAVRRQSSMTPSYSRQAEEEDARAYAESTKAMEATVAEALAEKARDPRLATMTNEDLVYEVLKDCFDPEIPLNVVDLGLIYEVKAGTEAVDVKMSVTSPACPSGATIAADIATKLTQAGFPNPKVQIVMEPAWTPQRISEAGRKALGI
jgi:metal-sulfur cluster biosynthetic enzyme